MDLLRIENVLKRFGDYIAVNRVSFQVGAGTILGLLGPNGAGKTTLIRMITSILIPDEGEVILFENKNPNNAQNRIGYLPEERGLYKNLKVIEQLIYFAQLKNVDKATASSRAKEWLRKMDAESWANKKIQELSKGMQQKVQFISTILHEPDLMILDEPFSGFDPINTELLKSIVLDMKEQGKTIILSTHVMEQAEQICDNICLIDKGSIVLKGNIREIKKSFSKDTMLLEFEGDDSFLNQFDGLKFINRTKNRAEFRLENSEERAAQILEAAVQNVELSHFQVKEPSLHEIFIDTVSKRKENGNEKMQ
ncbi:MAG: ATP-binding cassette domain-containing protein [Ignavibacteria bacterium]|nr:ATP-binding cassette domain-containing protein [Ignavibacteria bacterium]